MPRRSAEATAMATLAVPGAKLAPPEGLPAEAGAVFRAVVAALPTDWFRDEHAPLIEAFAVHTVNARHLAVEIETARTNGNPTPRSRG